MANPRLFSDDQLRRAVQAATCWADVMESVGKRRSGNQRNVRAVAARLGLDVSHFAYARSQTPVASEGLPFNNAARTTGRSGLSIAARWFLDRGYNVSVPLEWAPYDLIAESDDGLKKVQVKTTRTTEANGRHTVRLARSAYDPSVPRTARGNYRTVPYTEGAVDLFFVVTGTGVSYLIPFAAVRGVTLIVLDRKYAAFKVE